MLSQLTRRFRSRADYLRTLGLTAQADADAVKKAYYRLAKLYHPDVNPSQADRFKAVKDAYEALSSPFTPEHSGDYDFGRGSAHRSPHNQPPPSGSSYHKSKTAGERTARSNSASEFGSAQRARSEREKTARGNSDWQFESSNDRPRAERVRTADSFTTGDWFYLT
jgi:curved DNA-binding protein CbpA